MRCVSAGPLGSEFGCSNRANLNPCARPLSCSHFRLGSGEVYSRRRKIPHRPSAPCRRFLMADRKAIRAPALRDENSSRFRPTNKLPIGREFCGKPLQFVSQLLGDFNQRRVIHCACLHKYHGIKLRRLVLDLTSHQARRYAPSCTACRRRVASSTGHACFAYFNKNRGIPGTPRRSIGGVSDFACCWEGRRF
jgi:hypothetical protein